MTSIHISAGDTLSQIAQRHNTTVDALVSQNAQITNPDLIYAGDTLQLDGAGSGGANGAQSGGAQGTVSVSGASTGVGGGNAAAIAQSVLGRNASDLKVGSELPMEDWVPNNVNCANFVSGCLQKAGDITPGMASASVANLDGNLRGAGWQEVSLQNAKPGDVVIMPGRHVVLFAGMENGQAKFIGSNNVNADGSQRVSWGGASGNYHILSKPS